MMVYVVNFGWRYEGEATQGVFSSLDKAREALAKANLRGVDYAPIYEIQLDAPLSFERVDVNK